MLRLAPGRDCIPSVVCATMALRAGTPIKAGGEGGLDVRSVASYYAPLPTGGRDLFKNLRSGHGHHTLRSRLEQERVFRLRTASSAVQ